MFDVTLGHENESYDAKGTSDDGAYESIISFRIAEISVLNGIGKIKNIAFVTLQVALKNAAKFLFSRTWTASLHSVKAHCWASSAPDRGVSSF